MLSVESRRPIRPYPAPARRWRRRALRLAAAVGALGLMAGACGEPEQSQPPRGDQGVGSAADVANIVKPANGPPKTGGTLVVGLDAESEGFDPTNSRMAAAALTIGRAIFDPLVAIGEDLSPRPYLAEKIDPSNDYKTWDIKLRPNIKFHNGEALDSAALKKFLDKARASSLVGQAAKPIQSVDVVDPLSVRLQMDQSWATFPFLLVLQGGYVAAPSQLDSPDAAREPIGTGPFKFKSWETDKSLVVEKNPDYWRKGLPYLDAIDFRPIPDNQTRYQTLKSGQLDVTVTPREPTIQDLVKDGQAGTFQVVRAKGDGEVNMLMSNLSKPPFDDIRLRQAVAYAIDRQQFLALYNSPPEVGADGLYVKTSPWYVDAKFPGYDREKAKQLVDQIEAEKGPLKLTLDTVPDQDVQKNVTVMQSLLQDVGIEVAVNTTEQAALINKAISGDYQFMTWRQFGAVDPDANYIWWHSSNAGAGIALNMARNKDPEIDAALTQGRSSVDPEVRKKAYAKVQERQAIDLPYIWISHLRWTMGAANRVRNLETGTMPDGSKAVTMLQGYIVLNEFWLDG
jgi:4-phytase/acid phosphatase/peptide/nickel transport system substrate-binding protein